MNQGRNLIRLIRISVAAKTRLWRRSHFITIRSARDPAPALSPLDANSYPHVGAALRAPTKPHAETAFASPEAWSPSPIDHLQPSDLCCNKSQPQPKSTIHVKLQNCAQPSDLAEKISQPFSSSTIRVPSAHIQNLEDKVSTDPGDNDSGPTRPKRNGRNHIGSKTLFDFLSPDCSCTFF
ncbi:hypothetical protein SESBI_43448 [Sesbania bispinosa]|nr:hypothetical protein SESBI_43448 [Sesbania bispinosa]